MPPIMAGLAIVWAGLLFGGLLLGRECEDRTSRMPVWTRLASSAVLVIAAWLWTGQPWVSFPSTALVLVALGMTFGFAGDLFMAGLLPGPPPALGGMTCFGLGHVAYIAALLTIGGANGLTAAQAAGPWLAWLAVGTAGWYVVVRRNQACGSMHWAALPYSLLLASTAGVATAVALGAPDLWPLAVGGALFLGSDLVIAARIFRGARFPHCNDLIWLTYGPAQFLLVYGLHLG